MKKRQKSINTSSDQTEKKITRIILPLQKLVL